MIMGGYKCLYLHINHINQLVINHIKSLFEDIYIYGIVMGKCGRYELPMG